ncbi:MAG: signal peptidase I [Terracidiphilus sp.]|jgi:signal peptidase I
MTKKKTPAVKEASGQRSEAAPVPVKPDETPFEAVASICSVLVVGLYILTFLAQNFVIPSGSMEKTLLVGDHLVVDRISLAPPAKTMPLVHYREPRHGDIVVFIKPVPEPEPDADGKPQYLILVKRLIGVPGDHIHLHEGAVYLNGVAQPAPKDGSNDAGGGDPAFLDEFPRGGPPAPSPQVPDTWIVDFPSHIVDGDLVVPPGMYFMMGDNRHNSLDSRYWGFVPRQNIVGRPLFNYWSFKSTEEDYTQTEVSENIAWMVHVVTHFFSDTRWSRTFHLTR